MDKCPRHGGGQGQQSKCPAVKCSLEGTGGQEVPGQEKEEGQKCREIVYSN